MTRIAFRIAMAAAACAALLGATWTEAHSAQRKIEAIEGGRLRAGSTVLFTRGEMNSWAAEQTKLLTPGAVTGLELAPGDGRIGGTAQIDFLKLRQAATGEAPGFLAKSLLAGVRPVSATVRMESHNGMVRVDVERVAIAGVPVEGPALDFLIRTYLPAAEVGEWVRLNRRIDRIAVRPGGISVYIGRR